jgi:hypothetical protein
MGVEKQTKLTAWLALPARWAKTHRYKSKKRKNKLNQPLQPFALTHRNRATKPIKPKNLKKPKKTPPLPPSTTKQLPWNEVATLFQCNLQGQTLINADLQPFGDHQKPKKPNQFRIEHHNINNIPENGNAFKSQTLVRRVANSDNDVSLFQEIGINWRQSKG